MSGNVVLVPGLWMPGAAMALLAVRLARVGYRPRLFSYRGRSPLDANVERLAKFAPKTPSHFIGHSLGGLLILETLNRHPEVPTASALLLGSPVRGCLAGRRFGRLPGENDGVVCVSETTVEGMTARALVRQGHSLLGVSGQVCRLAERFLETGRFA